MGRKRGKQRREGGGDRKEEGRGGRGRGGGGEGKERGLLKDISRLFLPVIRPEKGPDLDTKSLTQEPGGSILWCIPAATRLGPYCRTHRQEGVYGSYRYAAPTREQR